MHTVKKTVEIPQAQGAWLLTFLRSWRDVGGAPDQFIDRVPWRFCGGSEWLFAAFFGLRPFGR